MPKIFVSVSAKLEIMKFLQRVLKVDLKIHIKYMGGGEGLKWDMSPIKLSYFYAFSSIIVGIDSPKGKR